MADEMTQRIKPRRTDVELKDLNILVRKDGDPFAIQTFTDAERTDAERYAAEIGGEMVDISWPKKTDEAGQSVS